MLLGTDLQFPTSTKKLFRILFEAHVSLLLPLANSDFLSTNASLDSSFHHNELVLIDRADPALK